MSDFTRFLNARCKNSGFTTEDLLFCFMPLLQQTIETHAVDKVAPLDGIDKINVKEGILCFFECDATYLRHNLDTVNRIEGDHKTIFSMQNALHTADEGGSKINQYNHIVASTSYDEITRPVYLLNYRNWECQLIHHDPITDIFCLGMILASLACGLDFTQESNLEEFVNNRDNLFNIVPQIHPVIAKTIFSMTELRRHNRAQNLETLQNILNNYRDVNADIDIDIDLLNVDGFKTKALADKQSIVLAKLQKRLFDLTRQNRLLDFRSTLKTLNLTHASVPLSFDTNSIKPKQIVRWADKFKADLLSGKPLHLNKYLNFSEAIYIPSTLDGLIAEARRDRTEYGFSQLKAAICFIKWADLKQDPAEIYFSPFIFLPITLTKKKRIRDTYILQAESQVAEINPVIRHQFQELYNIELPETLDLEKVSLEDFHTLLSKKILASEPAVEFSLITQPRMDVIQTLASQRLNQFSRRSTSKPRTKSYKNYDFNYDTSNFKPLGIQVFLEHIQPRRTSLQRCHEQRVHPVNYMLNQEQAKDVHVVQMNDIGSSNPYHWEFNLVNITLGNFKYRKMSLVQDYNELLMHTRENQSFNDIFSLQRNAANDTKPESLALDENYQVLSADPTQLSAIAYARLSRSYIIQGPPGTGKSQTITNLIIDYVARGQRVLFVCEKRAAIDVVFHRLQQHGLGQIATLIHDSQNDKKAFIMDLKACYESLTYVAEETESALSLREAQLANIEQTQAPLQQFVNAMQDIPEYAGIPVHQLLQRALRLALKNTTLTSLELEAFPYYQTWKSNQGLLNTLADILRHIQADGIYAHHPLHLLTTKIIEHDQPLHHVTTCAKKACDLVEEIKNTLSTHELPSDTWDTLNSIQSLVNFAEHIAPIAKQNLIAMLNNESDISKQFSKSQSRIDKQKRRISKAQKNTCNWQNKLAPDETQSALSQAKKQENSLLRFLSPSWWRLRKILQAAYRFDAHKILPSYTSVLENLSIEHEETNKLQNMMEDCKSEFEFPQSLEEFIELLKKAKSLLGGLTPTQKDLATSWLHHTHSSETIVQLAAMAIQLNQLNATLSNFITEFNSLSLVKLLSVLEEIENSLTKLPEILLCLETIQKLPNEITYLLRCKSMRLDEIEAAIITRTLNRAFNTDLAINRFSSNVDNAVSDSLTKQLHELQSLNANLTLEIVKHRFLTNFTITTQPAAKLTDEQKEFKQTYLRGVRILQHEFSKSMRYKSVRELASGDSGLVVNDLKPVWLMSPLSLSDTLPLDHESFDVVIFDEASQITLEQAIPALFRAKQAIIVGDEMQLPPTTFFAVKNADAASAIEDEEINTDDDTISYDISSNSFLNHAAKYLPSTMLSWHYRSVSESLISFNNSAFYNRELLTIPDIRIRDSKRNPIYITDQNEVPNVQYVQDRPLGFHYLSHGLYQQNINKAEAEYIAQLVLQLLLQKSGQSIGIIAFSEAQQHTIEKALEKLAAQNEVFRSLLEEEYEREENGQFIGLLVKNLENIQGDERDIIIISVCYGYQIDGKMRMNFGPINNTGGEKRLNVAFSRAKQHLVLVCSIRDQDITNEYNLGANTLKLYLRYVENCSIGNHQGSTLVLNQLSLPEQRAVIKPQSETEIITQQISLALRERGYEVDNNIGSSKFQINIAIYHSGDQNYRLGILIDTEEYYNQLDLIESNITKPTLLRRFGWNVKRVWTKNWYTNPNLVMDEIIAALSP